MARVYFDTNIFSYLKANECEPYQKLNSQFKLLKARLSFWFSYAHIRDKRKDLTDKKFQDFDFMETFVGDNYLAYHPIEKHTSFYLATPRIVYDDHPNNDLDDLLNFYNPVDTDDEYMKTFKQESKTRFSKFSWPKIGIEDQPMSDIQRKIINGVLPLDIDNPTFADVVERMSGFTRRLMSDAKLYKDMRKIANTGSNNGYLDLENENFNESLRNSPYGKSFLEYVRENMYAYKNKDYVPVYDFFMSGYNMLDLFSKTKDKVTPKNTPDNLVTDAMHTWFGQFCDIFVSEDATIRKKAAAMYRLFDVKTQVLSVNDFNELLPKILPPIEEDWSWFIEKLIYDMQNAERSEPHELQQGTAYRYKESCIYLDFFDSIIEIQGINAVEYVIFKYETNSISDPSFSEQSQIIDRAITVFGEDDEKKGSFNYRQYNEKPTILMERNWQIGALNFSLKMHQELNKYALSINFRRITDS